MFSREKHETILIQFLKIHAIEPHLVLIAALYSFSLYSESLGNSLVNFLHWLFKNSFIFLELTELPFLQKILLPPGLEKFKATCKSPSTYYFFPQSFLVFFIHFFFCSCLRGRSIPLISRLNSTPSGTFLYRCTFCPGNSNFLVIGFFFFWS